MNFYRTLLERDGLMPDVSHFDTLAAAHESAKGYSNHERGWLRIELIDVPTDKAGVLALLRGYSPDDFKPVRTWALTPRGGLKEVANGE